MTGIRLEVCVDDAAGLMAAVAGGADRIELCSALGLGGLTPSSGLMALAGTLAVPNYVMIRPRGGDFTFSADEVDIMRRDIDAVRMAGLAGVVLGASRPDGRLDVDVLATLVQHAKGLGLTLHRAFDLVPDLTEAVQAAIDLGFERILTSGRAPTAVGGIEDIVRTLDAASGRIGVMPGSGLTPQTLDAVLDRVSVTDVHASCSAAIGEPNAAAAALGFASRGDKRTDADLVRNMKARLAAYRA